MPDPARALAWDDFRLVNAIAETQTLPAAAARLGIDHSTVFRRLRQIEAAFGQPLFEKHRSGYVPTQAGEEVVALAARVDEDITAVTRRLAGQAPDPAGEIRLATSDALLLDLLMPLLARFRKACPSIRLELVVGNMPANLSRRDADVAVRATEAPPETLVGRRAGAIAWAAYGHQMLVEAEGATAMETSAWLTLGDNLARLKAAQAVQASISPDRIAAQFDSVSGLAAGVEAGMGVAYLPCFIGDSRPALVRLAPPVPALASELWLLTHADLRRTARIRTLLDFLAGELAGLRPLIEGDRRPMPALQPAPAPGPDTTDASTQAA